MVTLNPQIMNVVDRDRTDNIETSSGKRLWVRLTWVLLGQGLTLQIVDPCMKGGLERPYRRLPSSRL